MTFKIKLSKKSKDMLLELDIDAPAFFTIDNLNYWLRENQGSNYTKKQKFILESLKTVLSYDLKAHLKGKNPDLKKEKKTSWRTYAKFAGLLLAGTVMEGIEGFNGIAAVMEFISKSLITIPGIVTVVLGAVFSIVSISVFYAFELTQIANHFGISFSKARKLVDTYVDQLTLIRAIQRELGKQIIKTNDLNELNNYKATLGILNAQYNSIATATETLKRELNRPWMKVAKIVTAVMAGILYASGGFFSGNALGVMIFGSAAAAAGISATVFPPVIILASVIAVAAFCIYWYIERPSLQNFIGRITGLDTEKIDHLSDEKAAKADHGFFSILMDYIDAKKSSIEANQKLASYQEKNTPESPQALPLVQFSNAAVPVAESSEVPERGTVKQSPSVTQFSFLASPTIRQDNNIGLIASSDGDTAPTSSIRYF